MPEPDSKAGPVTQTETAANTPAPQDEPRTSTTPETAKGVMDYLDIPPEIAKTISERLEPPPTETPAEATPKEVEPVEETPAETPEETTEEEEAEEEGHPTGRARGLEDPTDAREPVYEHQHPDALDDHARCEQRDGKHDETHPSVSSGAGPVGTGGRPLPALERMAEARDLGIPESFGHLRHRHAVRQHPLREGTPHFADEEPERGVLGGEVTVQRARGHENDVDAGGARGTVR